MNPWAGWALAAAALAAGWFGYGPRGVALAVSVIAFWLLLQFTRLVRVMRSAAESPVGHVPSAVMLNAKLHAGLPMARIVAMTKSLGQRADPAQEIYMWTDAGGAAVRVTFANGRCTSWVLTRPPE
ncbi:MAG: hypothetical protein ABI887_03010 [Burkholderiales bacterium]